MTFAIGRIKCCGAVLSREAVLHDAAMLHGKPIVHGAPMIRHDAIVPPAPDMTSVTVAVSPRVESLSQQLPALSTQR